MSDKTIIPWAKANLTKKLEFDSAFRNKGISIDYINDAKNAIDKLTNVEYPIVLIDMEQTTSKDIGMDVHRLICGTHNDSWKIGDYVLEKILSKKSKNKDSIVIVTGKYNPEMEGNLFGVRSHVEELGAHSYYHLDEGVSGLIDIVKKLI